MAAGKNTEVQPDFAMDELCIFCPHRIENKILAEYGTVVAIRDEYPVTQGHLLILTRRHTPDLFHMTLEEQQDMLALVRILRDQALEKDASITGFNIGMNCGVSAGQTIPHAHLHFIPRRDGDAERPRGGVRGVIPGKQGYPKEGES